MNSENETGTFEEVLEDNKASIYRICRIYAVSPMEPKDLFQEVVFNLWKSYASYNGASQTSTWVYRIALNVCMRYKLKLDKHSSRTTKLSAITINSQAEFKDEAQEERFEVLRSCIQNLKEADRSILVLFLEGLAYREMAEITGLTENHIAVKMKRIRTTLFDCMTPKLR